MKSEESTDQSLRRQGQKYRGRGETVESSNTHVFEVPVRNERGECADARAEEIMAESISELTKTI